MKKDSNVNLNDVLDQATDSYNCNLKEKNVAKCFEELDKKYFFKKRKYHKCLEIQKEFQHCLIYSNEINLNKRTVFKAELNRYEIYDRVQEAKLENKLDAFAFSQGQITEEDLLAKKDNPNARKKIVEL